MSIINRILNWLKNPGGKLSRQVIQGGFWVFTIRILRRLFGILKLIVIARLLSPEDFGLFGIAMLALAALQSFSKTGFNQAIIQKKEGARSYLDTAWTVGIIRNLALAGLLVLLAPFIGSFFGEPGAVFLARMLAVAVAIKGFTNVGVIYFRKELQFHKQFLYESASIVVNIAVAIPLAFILRSALALVFAIIVSNAVQMFLSYVLHPFRPELEVDLKKAKELYDFGKWIFGSSIVVFIALHGDDIFAGKYLGAAALGIYQLSFKISNSMATEITHVIGQVTFPAFSKLQNNVDRLREAFFNTVEASVGISVPLAAGIFLLAPDFVHVVLEPKWEQMIPILRILTVSGLLRSMVATGGPLVNAVGKPRLDFRINLLRSVLIAVSIYPLTRIYGLSGTAYSVLLGLTGSFLLWIKFTSRTTNTAYGHLLKKLAPPLLGSLIMVAVIVGVKQFLPQPGLPLFFAIIFLGVITYTIYSIIVWKMYDVGPLKSLQVMISYARNE